MIFSCDRALAAAVLLAACSMSLVTSTAVRADSAAPDSRRVEETTSGPGEYAPPTKEQKLVSCMALWEPETHMTKELWKTVCKRMETEK